MKIKLTLGLIGMFVSQIFAQNDATVRAYIERYKKIAVEEMLEYGIPASITIAQGIHESGAGTSKLAINSNNHFGIKCHKDWEGSGYKHDDDKPQECFRVYENPEESYRDHSKFLKGRKWYTSLFDLPSDDYVNWAHGLKKAGYATNPKYAQILVSLIDKYQLHKLDKIKKADLDNIASISFTPPVAEEAATQESRYEEKAPEKHQKHKYHHVEKGESLYAIAKKYETTVEVLKKSNHLSNTNLYVGQKLIIKQ